MRDNIKITKREMKEDKFATFVFKSKDYVVENWIYFVGGIAAIIVLVVAASFLGSQETGKQRTAVEVYNRAMNESRSGSFQLAIVDFKAVLDDYGSSDLAPQAAFNLANSYFNARNFTEAQTSYELYLKKYADDDPYFNTSAIAGIAASLAGLGDLKGAADKFREAAEKYPDFKLAGNYYLQAMEYYIKAKEMESAKVVFAKITKEYEDTPYFMDGTRLAAEYKIKL